MRFQQARNLTLYCQSSPAIRYTSACFFHLIIEAKRHQVKRTQTPPMLTDIVHPEFSIALSSQCWLAKLSGHSNLTMTPQAFVLRTLSLACWGNANLMYQSLTLPIAGPACVGCMVLIASIHSVIPVIHLQCGFITLAKC